MPGSHPTRDASPVTVPADRSPATDPGSSPANAGVILGCLILVAAVANLNLAVANVALPSIGQAFNASQTAADPSRQQHQRLRGIHRPAGRVTTEADR